MNKEMILKQVFFWLINYHKKEGNLARQKVLAYVVLGFLIMMNIVSIVLFVNAFFGINYSEKILTNSSAMNRFVIIPLVSSPVFLILFLYYWNNKKRIDFEYRQYNRLPGDKKKPLDSRAKAYVIGTFIMLLLGIISPVIKTALLR